MFILKEISYNKYKLLVLSEQLKEEDLKPLEKKSFWSFFSWKKPKNTKDLILKEIKKTSEEIKTLKKAHNDTFFGHFKEKKSFFIRNSLDYCEYLQEVKKENFSRTLYGRILNKSARFLAGYCVYKLFMSILNYILGRKKTIDPISRVLGWFFDINQESYKILSNDISFVFMGKFPLLFSY